MPALRPAGSRRSIVMRVLLFLAILFVVLFLFAQFLRRTGMFYPERHPAGMWDTSRFAIQPEEHTFTTSDGVKLHAWLFRGGAPLLIWHHGNGGNITHRAEIAIELARRGISVFLFDWRGYGRSEGTPSEGKLYLDSLAAYDYARRLTPGDIILYGESLGGPYAAYVAARRKARCVIIENSFPSLRAVGNILYKPLPLGWFAPRAMATQRWLNEAGAPVLVMHGRRDAVIPFALGQELYDGLRVPKEMLVSERAGHCEIAFVEAERYYAAVTRFATKP